MLSTPCILKALQAVMMLVAGTALALAEIDIQGTNTPPFLQRHESNGIAVEFSLTPATATNGAPVLMEGADAIATFRMTDARTGQPIGGMRPKAWLTAHLSESVASEVDCKDKVRGLLSGQLSTRADSDLNGYVILTLNHDKTVTIINPQIAFNATKLESVFALPGDGADWVLSKSKEILYVAMPAEGAIAVINMISRKLITTLATGKDSRPTRLALSPDGVTVWVGLDGAPEVAAIDTITNSVVSKIGVGNGLHTIAFNADDGYTYVSNSSDSTVSVIDSRRLLKSAEIKVGQTPVAMVFSRTSGALYVAAINGGDVSVIDATSFKLRKTIPLSKGLVTLGAEPENRYIFAVNQLQSMISVIDTATDSVVSSTQVVKEPDQITFTQRYAYVRGIGSEKFSLIDLGELKKGQLVPVDIQAGRLPPSNEPKEIGVAAMIVPAPEGNAVVIANAPDRTLYYYQEGMMAPMGTFSNYKRMPRALMILDRGLTETETGVYTAHVKLTKGGRFDVPVLIDQPRLVNCFQVTVAEQPGDKKLATGASVQIEAQFDERDIRVNKSAILKFKIIDSASKAPVNGLGDVQALVFEPPGVWQQRHGVKELGNGIYALDQSFPHAGVFNVMLAIPSRGVHYADLQPHSIRVMAMGKRAAKLGQTAGANN